jgi:hypothetical protein
VKPYTEEEILNIINKKENIQNSIVINTKDTNISMNCNEGNGYEIELDDEIINISAIVDYEVKYEDDVDYAYISWASIDIKSSTAYNDDGDAIKFNYNVSKIEKYIKNYLTE